MNRQNTSLLELYNCVLSEMPCLIAFEMNLAAVLNLFGTLTEWIYLSGCAISSVMIVLHVLVSMLNYIPFLHKRIQINLNSYDPDCFHLPCIYRNGAIKHATTFLWLLLMVRARDSRFVCHRHFYFSGIQ